ncbi:MAG TPA: pilus assembly protein PilM [Polyangiaceae bacterium]|nr:pilus assembly protein PilM [Polyangiaceae bacterium]
MSKLIGIDIRSKCVRVATLSARMRKVSIDSLVEVSLQEHESTSEAIKKAFGNLVLQGDPVAAGFQGDACFIHRMELPTAAGKRLAQVIPFELEAQVPIDVEELVYDYSQLSSSADGLIVLAAAARLTDVQQRINLIRTALGREPERISVAGLPLANLASVSPALAAEGPIALFDMGDRRSELVILIKGKPVFARAISAGVEGLPASASVLAAGLRQTLAAWSLAGGAEITAIYLCGSGSAAAGASEYLSQELALTVQSLPLEDLALPAEDPRSQGQPQPVPARFARAIGIALGLRAGARDMDLRRGSLSYQRGYGFLKEKVPLLAGLTIAVFFSFLFFAWAQTRTLNHEQQRLTAQLGAVSKQVLHEETVDPERVNQLLMDLSAPADKDPQPTMDAFDVLVKFSEAIPTEITHDVEEFDVQRGHVKVYGIVDLAEQAEKVSTALSQQECFEGAKVSKISQKVNSDRQKYALEFEVKCPEDQAKSKPGSSGGANADKGDKGAAGEGTTP